MTDCCMETIRFDRQGRMLGGAEVNYADMIARGTYRVVAWAARAYGDRTARRRAMKALDRLEALDDRHLADIGLRRDDLTLVGLATAAAERNRARATAGYQA